MNESLVKYLAGLLDADGSLSFAFKHDQNRVGRYFVRLRLGLTASDAVDHNGFVESLPELTGMGSVSRYGKSNQFAAWNVTKRTDLETFIPRLTKHMCIKAKHWTWLLNMWRDLRSEGKTVSVEERNVLSEASKESRRNNSGPLKPKNHPTWCWLAGYLDGDGCYRYKNYSNDRRKQWAMSVSAVAHVNDICVLEFLHKSFGGRIEGQGQSDNVKIWIRSLGHNNRDFALSFLPNVAKHSQLKRPKIDAMIHHHQQRLSVPGKARTFCTIDDCGKPSVGFNKCRLHYDRWWRSKRALQATV